MEPRAMGATALRRPALLGLLALLALGLAARVLPSAFSTQAAHAPTVPPPAVGAWADAALAMSPQAYVSGEATTAFPTSAMLLGAGAIALLAAAAQAKRDCSPLTRLGKHDRRTFRWKQHGNVRMHRQKESTEFGNFDPEAPAEEPVAAALVGERTVSATDVKALRERSGAGILDCQKALKESAGDMDAAVAWLKKKGIATADKKAGNVAVEGGIASYVHFNKKIGVIVEVNSETDFVANNQIFRDFVGDVAMQIAANPSVVSISSDDVPADVKAKEKELEMAKEDLAGKPNGIKEKIVEGRLRKKYEDMSLLNQKWLKDEDRTVQEILKERIAKLGENIVIRRFKRLTLGEGLAKKEDDFAAGVEKELAKYRSAGDSPLPEKPKEPKAEASKEEPKEEQEAKPAVAVSAAMVKELRERSGAGIMDSKKALAACEADMEKAMEWLKKKGIAKADKKAGNLAVEGGIASYVHFNNKIAVIVEVNSETDFVANNEIFKEFTGDVAMQIAANPSVVSISSDDVPADVKAKEKELEMAKEDLVGKPDDIKGKIVEGRLRKKYEEMSLLNQTWLKNEDKTVQDVLKERIAKLGENIVIRRFERLTLGEGLEKKEDNFAAGVEKELAKYRVTGDEQTPESPKEEPKAEVPKKEPAQEEGAEAKEAEAASRDECLARLEAELQAVKTSLNDLRADNDELRRRLADGQADAQAKIQGLEIELMDVRADLSRLQTSMEAPEPEKEELAADTKAAEPENAQPMAEGNAEAPKEEEKPAVTVSAAMVKELRQRSGAGIMDSKKALAACDADMEKAMDWLKKKGIAKADKKAGNVAVEGGIAAYVHFNNKIAVIVEVNSETDFVANNGIFKEFAADVAMQIAANPSVVSVSSNDVPADVKAKEKELEMAKEDLAGKPVDIKEKNVAGRLRKKYEEMSLLSQVWLKDENKTVQDILKERIAKLGENIVIRRFERLTLGEGLEKKEDDFAAGVEKELAKYRSDGGKPAPEKPTEEPKSASPKEEPSREQDMPSVAVSAAMVKELRERSGAGIMDSKKALAACNADMEKAMEWLKKKGIAKADKKAGNATVEGGIASYVHFNGKLGVIVEVNSETDFVANNAIFKEFTSDVAMQIAANPSVVAVSADDVPEDVKAKEKDIEMAKEDLAGKPDEIKEKIVMGRLRKKYEDMSLMSQKWLKDEDKTVQDVLKERIAKLGENLVIRRFSRLTLGEGLEKEDADFAAGVEAELAKYRS